MKQAWLVYNPGAGRFPARPLLPNAIKVLESHGWQISLRESHDVSTLRDEARSAVKEGIDTVFVVGGDGSTGAVAGELAGSGTALGVLPAGTTNVWAQELGLPRLSWTTPGALEQAARRLATAQIRTVDLGLVDGHHFLLWAGVGLDGKIVNAVEPRPRWEKAFAAVSYAVRAVWESLDWQGIDLRIEANGQVWEDRFLLAVASNIRGYAGGILELSPDAKVDDGLLDLWLLKGKSIGEAVAHTAQILLGAQEEHPHIVYFRSQDVTFESDSSLPIHYDAEPLDVGTRAHLTVKPKSLKILVPEGRWPDVLTQDDVDAGVQGAG